MYFYDLPLKVSEKNAVLKRAINILIAALLAFAFNKFVDVNIIQFYSQIENKNKNNNRTPLVVVQIQTINPYYKCIKNDSIMIK